MNRLRFKYDLFAHYPYLFEYLFVPCISESYWWLQINEKSRREFQVQIEDEDIGGEELQEIVESGDGRYEVSASTEIGKIERLFDMEIAADDFTTIAGLVINESGKVPAAGERLAIRGLEAEVLEADERRILRLRVRKAEEQNATEASHG